MWSDKQIIDLTLTLKEGMRGVATETTYTVAEHGWNASTYHLYSHAGTHLDAPLHYDVSDKTVEDIPLSQCMGPAWVADVSHIGPKGLITVAHLGDIPNRIAPGDSLLIKTGWSKYHGKPAYREELPRISEELACWCAERNLPMVGVEPPAVADPFNREEITQIHRILLGADIVIVEGLTNLDALTRDKVMFCAVPIKIAGDGAPVRAFAVEFDSEIGSENGSAFDSTFDSEEG